jgi:hypothetical protein
VFRWDVKRLWALGDLRCSLGVAEKLKQISAKTIDWVLAHE